MGLVPYLVERTTKKARNPYSFISGERRNFCLLHGNNQLEYHYTRLKLGNFFPNIFQISNDAGKTFSERI